MCRHPRRAVFMHRPLLRTGPAASARTRLRPLAHQSAVLTLCALLTAGLAGCTAEDPAADAGLLGADGAADEQGMLHVMAYAEYGAPLDGARVSLLGTIFGQETDGTGVAQFPNVPSGTYTLRIEMNKFLPEEREVAVAAGGMAHEEFTLLLKNPSGDARTHLHDYWGSDTEVLVVEAEMPAVPRYQTDTFAWWPEGYNNALNGIHRMNNNQTGEDPDYTFRVPWEETTPDGRPALIYPGTALIDITLDWDSPLTRAEKMGVAYIAPESDELVLLARQPSGSLWSIPILPHMADNGHQAFSFWNFFLYSGNDPGNPDFTPQYSFDEPFHVTVTVHKGAIPHEPPHRDFWEDGPVKQLRIEAEQEISTMTVRDWRVENSGHVFLPEDVLVPPGTRQLVVEYTYIHGDPNNNDDQGTMPQPQTLTFRMADQNPWETPVGEYRQFPATECAEPAEAGTCLRYDIDLESGWSDAFYQTKSLWAFLTNVEGSEDERRYTPSAGGQITMLLDITMVGPDA